MNIGDNAPDFVLKDQNDREIRLSDEWSKGSLVVFFYPRDGTPVCTMEACSFRDNYESFKQYNANVLGVSSDDEESHRRFAEKNHLNYTLLWDKDGELRKLWGVPATMGVLPGRVTYVVDSGGVVRDIFSSQLNVGKHVSGALEAVKKLAAMGGSGA